ncbi:alpha-L-rhamnosidase [bacterium]|nr:alpha-L-rhamnosidase [bacterium]
MQYPKLVTDSAVLQEMNNLAVDKLRANVQRPFPVREEQLDMPLIVEGGGGYPGVWLESGPLNGLVYGRFFDVDVARANHRIFFLYQREDDAFPCWFIRGKVGFSQIQMVVPIAKTAWEFYELTGESKFLEEAYSACSRWDGWLAGHRDSRGIDLVELFCEYDTGHDNSGRFTRLCPGLPKPCPEHDARNMPAVGTVPWLAPDLSATHYGGRVALAKMAAELGRPDEAEVWTVKAERTRRSILAYLFDPETLSFYDLDRNNRFQRIVSDVLSRVLCEHVVDQLLFDNIFERHIVSPHGFWSPYPMPSVALSDPLFNRDLPDNCWGGPAQGLTGVRAPRWFEHYGRPAELAHMMTRWLEAIGRQKEFRQQMNPWNGEISGCRDYSPTLCLTVDYISRLYGVRAETDRLEWNVRLPEGATRFAYSIETKRGQAELRHEQGEAVLSLGGKNLLRVAGTGRVVTDLDGNPTALVGTELKPATFRLTRVEGGKVFEAELKPNESRSGGDL